MDKHLSWKPHIDYINTKLAKAIGIMSKIRYNIPKYLLNSIYYAFFQPHIDYNILNWGCATKHNTHPIEMSQKKIARIMTFSDYDAHTNVIFKNLKILDLDKQIQLNQGKLIWKAKQNQLPKPISAIFNKTTASGRITTNITCRTNYKERFLTNTCQENWKLIPEEIKNKNTLHLFSKHYKELLIVS